MNQRTANNLTKIIDGFKDAAAAEPSEDDAC